MYEKCALNSIILCNLSFFKIFNAKDAKSAKRLKEEMIRCNIHFADSTIKYADHIILK